MLEKEEQLNKNIFKSSEIFLNFATLFCYSYCIIYQEEIKVRDIIFLPTIILTKG